MRLVFASHNEGKIKEMRELLADLPIQVVSAEEAGVSTEVVEDQDTFEGNALKKARVVSEATQLWAVADDSGISIDALGGAPGVYTARWAGEGKSGDDLVAYTLEQLKGVPFEKRSATFTSVLALVSSKEESWTFRGEIKGVVAEYPRGTMNQKLPYDVIFIPKGREKTFAEMSSEEKNSLSHRGEAFMMLKKFFLAHPDFLSIHHNETESGHF